MTSPMPQAARIIDGKALALEVRRELRERVAAFVAARGIAPHLAVVLASDDPASAVYVRNKGKAAAEVGIRSSQHVLPAHTEARALLELVERLSADPDVDGILVQLPLPRQHDVDAILAAIDPAKDVDGLSVTNAGRLSRGDETGLIPCTPLGVIRLIQAAGVELDGRHAVVLGRSRLVGRPAADLLINRNATVTVCHSRTRDLASEVARADVVVAAIGKPELVKGSWIKFGATVIDVGTNKTADGKLVGDVAFHAARERAAAITPVPGGVGPMTITYLLHNTVLAAERRRPAPS
jgi:methylenetetrahydrofolate dehydrogenase (NADP+)/methenyltetrahydrofolate cyclohydrolase